jgi:tRNA G18 (ribose-2'-O)-methylase SpoU
MFRTADGAGVSRIILSGYTPGHTDPRGKERAPFIKVSLGAEKIVPYSRSKSLSGALKKLKQQGYTIVAIEQSPRSVSLFEYAPSPDEKLAVIMGNEVRGISTQSLKHADHILHIPMRGKKESLNVGVAAGIALFTLLK